MYCARLVHFKLKSGQRDAAEKITREFDKISRNLRGFRGNVYFFDDQMSEYRALNYWDTKEDAENAHKLLFPKLVEELKSITAEQPTYKYFEVYDPTDDTQILRSHTIK